MNVKDRIEQLIAAMNIKRSTFEKAIGLSNSYIRNVKNVSAETCAKIVEVYPNVSLDWLILGFGKMFREDATTVGDKIDTHAPNSPGKVIGNVDYHNSETVDSVKISEESPDAEACDSGLEYYKDFAFALNSETVELESRLKERESDIRVLQAILAEKDARIAELKEIVDLLKSQIK